MNVSVVIPCFNAANFLSDAIESALRQTRPPAEIIVVDDGSTDDSLAVAESFGSKVHIVRQANRGPAFARNTGVAHASGSYLMFLDADDLLAPEALGALVAAIGGRPNCVALMDCAVFDADPSEPIDVQRAREPALLPRMLSTNMGVPVRWLTPRALFNDVGGFEDGTRPSEDWDLWAQIALRGAELVCVPVVGAYYREHANSVMRTVDMERRTRGHAKVMERLAGGMLARPALLEQWGSEMFWQGWTALCRARDQGIPWRELQGLSRNLQAVARHGPATLRCSVYARSMSVLGAPIAETLRRWCLRRA